MKLADEFRRFHEGRKELEGRSSAGEEVGAREAAFLAGRLYVRLLKIHPFVDGNLRTAYLSLQAALLTLGLPGVEFPPDEVRHNEALIVAMAPGGRRQSYDPITDLILEQIPLDT